MANHDDTTTRYCRYCDGHMVASIEPSGDPCLECARCAHTVELATLADSTLAAPRGGKGSKRRRQMGELQGQARRIIAAPGATPQDFAMARGLMLASRYIAGDRSALQVMSR